MELDEFFTKGKHSGRSLTEVWQGSFENLTFQYIHDLTQLINRKTNLYQKLYCPIFNLEIIENEFDEILTKASDFNIVCTNEYIIIESGNDFLIQKIKKVLKTILTSKFHFHNLRFFLTDFEDIRHTLPCEVLKIEKISRVTDKVFLLYCSQIIFGEKKIALEKVNINFIEKNGLLDHVENLTNVGDNILLNCSYPIIDNQTSNIETVISLDDNHPIGSGIKLKPQTSKTNDDILKTENGDPIYLKTYIVRGEAKHKLDIEDYPKNEEPTLSEGSKKLMEMMGDPNYIEYCMRNWNDFYINNEDLETLRENKSHNLTFLVEEITATILKYSPQFIEFDYVIKKSALEENEFKNEKNNEVEIEEEFEYFQKYGESSGGNEEFHGNYGFDDDTINDAFEGDPDNYWNID